MAHQTKYPTPVPFLMRPIPETDGSTSWGNYGIL